jgi:Zn-dependent protease with chaperone function
VVLGLATASAAVLSTFSAGIAVASRLLEVGADGRPVRSITAEIDRLGWPLWLLYVASFAITLLVGARLMVSIVGVAIATRRRRAHHRMLVDLLGITHESPAARAGARAGELRILEIAQPLAYCLPGVRSRVVVSEGTLNELDDSEVTAILAHEGAHLRARHDLVLEAFTAVHAAFPRFVRSRSALDAVRLLIELLADDAAVRRTGPAPLGRALVACAGGHIPSGAMSASGPTTLVRVRRLAGRPNSAALAVAAYVSAAAVLVVPTIAVAVPWLTELRRLLTG